MLFWVGVSQTEQVSVPEARMARQWPNNVQIRARMAHFCMPCVSQWLKMAHGSMTGMNVTADLKVQQLTCQLAMLTKAGSER